MDGQSRRVAVCVGPEHGTVGPQFINEAAKEAGPRLSVSAIPDSLGASAPSRGAGASRGSSPGSAGFALE